MQRKIHMQDQVGANKIEALMRHNYSRCFMQMWAMKFIAMGTFLGRGVYSKFFV